MTSSFPLSWSLSANFSTQNSNSIWSYGSKPGYLPNGEFTRFTNLVEDPNNSGVVALFKEGNTWDKDWLGVYYNTKSTTTLLVSGSNMTFTAHGVCIHPGNVEKDFVVIKFTAPVNGIYSINAKFLHVDDHAEESNTSTGAYVMHNNAILWEEIIIDYIPESFITDGDGIEIYENDTVDFLLGIGTGGDYHMTSINVDISAREEDLPTSTTSKTTSSQKPSVSSGGNNNINNNNNNNNNRNSTKIYLVGGSIGLILGLIIGSLFFICYLCRRKKKRLLIPSQSMIRY
ncbi:hypothetical protein Glove_225g56 [Diversispora epigaea]|uniref:Uncharacterized protein n=1 Tax=Diversispora epigaea TaxID=1348612 RepID=A0A397IHP2_9GLOM|nr:hypothetical protein Glove_225g56 [Diversispora epigaea]